MTPTSWIYYKANIPKFWSEYGWLWKKCLSAYKSCNISETGQERKYYIHSLYKVAHTLSIGTNVYGFQ